MLVPSLLLRHLHFHPEKDLFVGAMRLAMTMRLVVVRRLLDGVFETVESVRVHVAVKKMIC